MFDDTHAIDDIVTPAWLCENPQCGYRILARHVRTPPKKITTIRETLGMSRQVNAVARRTLMKSHACVDRTLSHIAKTQKRIDRTKRKAKRFTIS